LIPLKKSIFFEIIFVFTPETLVTSVIYGVFQRNQFLRRNPGSFQENKLLI